MSFQVSTFVRVPHLNPAVLWAFGVIFAILALAARNEARREATVARSTALAVQARDEFGSAAATLTTIVVARRGFWLPTAAGMRPRSRPGKMRRSAASSKSGRQSDMV